MSEYALDKGVGYDSSNKIKIWTWGSVAVIILVQTPMDYILDSEKGSDCRVT